MNKISNAGTHRRLAVIAATAVMAASALLSVASPTTALAAPKGIFAIYEQCPTSVPGVAICQYAEITSGEFTIGSLKIPVDKKIVLQGGDIHTGGLNENEYFTVPAANGESISKTELSVPGGLSALADCDAIKGRGFERNACRAFVRHGRNDVGVIVEPAASSSNPVIVNLVALALESKTALTFPVKLHFESPLLGETCHIGSETTPIELHLTTGTTSPPPPNQPIAGKSGTFIEEEEQDQSSIVDYQNTLVDNAFSVPIAEGCGGHHEAIVDTLIDHTLGLESPAGHNTVIFNGIHSVAEVGAVLASEKFPAKEETTPPSPPHHHHHHHHWWWPTD